MVTLNWFRVTGLYLNNIKWTPLGLEKAINYKDISPAVITANDGTLTGLDSLGMTPNGAVKGLTFYSATNFDDMFKYLSANREVPDYNVGGANAGVKQTDGNFVTNVYDAGDKDEYDEHGPDCECASCMAANDPAVHKKHIEEFDSEDHFSKYGDVTYADKENHKYPIDTKATKSSVSLYQYAEKC